MRTKITLSLAVLLAASAAGAATPNYSVSGSIAGPDGGWDYAQVDPVAHRLYIAHGDAVTVVDLNTNQVSSLGSFKRSHAVVPLSGNRLLVTSGGDGTVRFLNTADDKELASVKVGENPDAAILDASGKRAFVMNAESGEVSIFDTATMRLTQTIPVKPALEYAALLGDTLFINNEDDNELNTVDLASGKVGASIALTGCEGPTGLGLDAKHSRLISSCANGKAAIVDAKAHKLTGLVDIGKGPDAVIMDEQRGLAFIPAGGDGELDILSLASPTEVTKVGSVKTERGARTGALDPTTDNVYLPATKLGEPAKAGARPAAVPGSFHIIVVKPN
jgi:YVTN family beta-propeller protein